MATAGKARKRLGYIYMLAPGACCGNHTRDLWDEVKHPRWVVIYSSRGHPSSTENNPGRLLLTLGTSNYTGTYVGYTWSKICEKGSY